ncbi:hypothetical protein I6F35_22330 [Bradyrhizobium sp. BRP22]|uniref:hypothetical protein n=1 Tax=Bradyrhizobium sp. BRP22 TaxID=2793821 RepID=UPI001CD5059F|nr:hypothetical protein [Bradyrhizobium sp. BRP22]MCA1455907.1 hypothetical protein [Bradyrhizobium sp. BRP22]
MNESAENTPTRAEDQAQIDRAARIIDQFAFREKQPLMDRQRIARNKASIILADATAEREELLNELVSAHRQMDMLLTGKLEVTSPELWCGVKRRIELLARYGRLLP